MGRIRGTTVSTAWRSPVTVVSWLSIMANNTCASTSASKRDNAWGSVRKIEWKIAQDISRNSMRDLTRNIAQDIK